MSNETKRCARSLKRLVSWRWKDCTKTYQRLEHVGDCPHDAAIRKVGARWEVWIGTGGKADRDCIGNYTSRAAAERAAILNVEHLERKTANRCIPTPVLDSDKGATKTDKNQSKS